MPIDPILREEFNPKQKEDFVVENKTRILKESAGKYNKIIIDAIHPGVTKNHVDYTETSLSSDSALKSWTKPNNKPVLKNHDDCDADSCIGRVVGAEYVKNKKGVVRLQAQITDLEALQKIEDQRYYNVSIGSTIHKAHCSVCEKDLLDGWCGHYRGIKYDKDGNETKSKNGKLCTWVIDEVVHDEVSVVNIPADEQAKILCIVKEGENELDTIEFQVEDSEVTIEEEKTEEEFIPEAKDDCYAYVDGEVKKYQFKNSDGTPNQELLDEASRNLYEDTDIPSAGRIKSFALLKQYAIDNGLNITESECKTYDICYDELKETIKSLESENSLLKIQVEEFEKTVNRLESSMYKIVKENTCLISKIGMLENEVHKEKVEHLIDIKTITNKSNGKAKDEVIEEYEGKNNEILSELINEYKISNTVLEAPPKVLNETLPMRVQAANDIVENKSLMRPDRELIKRAVNGDEKAKALIEKWKKQ